MTQKMLKQIPNRQLISNMRGQNDWLNGCLEFLMECLEENKAYDYWFFSGVTGDSFTQIFSKNPRRPALCYSDGRTEQALEKAFRACGCAYDHYTDIREQAREGLERRVRDSINQNVPVIARINDAFRSFAILCGYDEENLYDISGEDKEPKPCRYDELIFVAGKTERPSLAAAYRKAVLDIPSLLQEETVDFSFGTQAFLDWAESFQNGSFDAISLDDPIWHTHDDPDFSCWSMHGNYLCMLGTNACAMSFLQEAQKRNPDLHWVERLIPLYQRLNGDGFASLIEMENGFTLKPEVLKDKTRMRPICDTIRELAGCCGEILQIFTDAAER